ncbi:MAG: peptidoglycan DD-metalloendopeptidase family protein [Patescibacteria group bacterium]|nr:peptidoglycan DD-metalloendopeptidase family protein [Patescibacteria group bacterium]
MAKNKNQKVRRIKILVVCLIFSFGIANFFAIPLKADDDVSSLNHKITDQKSRIDELQKEIDAYQKQIQAKQQEAKSLQNQLAILDNQIAKVNLDIEETQIKINQTNLEIQKLNLEIKDTEKNIFDSKTKIGEYLRLIYRDDQVSYLEILLNNHSFSDFFDQVKYTEQVHNDIKDNLDKLKMDKNQLEIQKSNWQSKSEEENKLKDQLQQQKAGLDERKTAQQVLYSQTRLTQKQYQSYAYQLQLEQQQANADIISAEKKLRQKLEEQQNASKFGSLGPARLTWPVGPGKGISTYFHDPDYPFRYLFEHPGLDIRVPQGTPIKAPESGYVGKVNFKGDKSYAYLMILHSDGLSTVFGHISTVYVKEDEYVTKGQMIALTGATPGTIGAGPYTTGPHLHFEVRLNGIPVNPLEYLPTY